MSDQGEAASAPDLLGHFMKKVTELSANGITILGKDGKPVDFLTLIKGDRAFAEIISKFSYPEDGDTSTVEDRDGLINAFFANDLYKLSMAPVIHHVTLDNNGCVVQFKVDLRT